jgi:sucrose-phosphate synthase
MSGGARRVMEGILKQIDALDLYGSVAIPKHHTQEDISDIYACALLAFVYL